MRAQDLEKSLNDGITVAPPSEYIDNAGPGLLPDGVYNLVLRRVTFVKDEAGNFKNRVVINEAVVADGEYEKRFVRDLNVWTTPFLREGVLVSQLGDLIRGVDSSLEWQGRDGAENALNLAIDQQIPIRMKLIWEGFDHNGYLQEGGREMVKKSPEEKALRKRATLKKMASFPTLPSGAHRTTAIGPISGEPVEARLVIDRVYPKK